MEENIRPTTGGTNKKTLGVVIAIAVCLVAIIGWMTLSPMANLSETEREAVEAFEAFKDAWKGPPDMNLYGAYYLGDDAQIFVFDFSVEMGGSGRTNYSACMIYRDGAYDEECVLEEDKYLVEGVSYDAGCEDESRFDLIQAICRDRIELVREKGEKLNLGVLQDVLFD